MLHQKFLTFRFFEWRILSRKLKILQYDGLWENEKTPDEDKIDYLISIG